jgi:XTP/dITP diphosphohydrolase
LNELLLATDNAGKVREYSLLPEGLPFTLVTPDKKGGKVIINESDTTMEDNAVLKARTYAQASNPLTLADGSGLEVDALAGEPGPHSARYAGEGASKVHRLRFGEWALKKSESLSER